MKYYTLLLSFVMLFLTACSVTDEYPIQIHHTNKNNQQAKQLDEEALSRFQKKITIAAVGDLLIHDRVYEDAWNGEMYDFRPMLEPVSSYLQAPSITVANQETIMGGEELGLSGYPRFNSPYEIGDQLKEFGVDIVTMANNHTLDRGEEAIQNAIRRYEEIGMSYTGSFKSKEDQQNIRVIDTDEGISVAFLSYTYGTNGIRAPNGKGYLVNRINRQQIRDDVERAGNQADVTILSYHFGNEYERLPSEEQKDLAQFAADLGVEVVIGHHPHVLQPLEWLKRKNGNNTLVAYSLGNFLSGQYELYQRIGGILQVCVIKKENQIIIEDPSFLPTFVDFEMVNETMTNIKVIPLDDVTENQLQDAASHKKEIKEHLSQHIEDLQFLE